MMMAKMRTVWPKLGFVVLVMSACDFPRLSELADAGGGTDATGESDATNTVPIIGIALDRSYQTNKGLVGNLESHGWPIREGSMTDPTVVESRRFYDTLKAPNAQPVMTDYPDPFTGAPPSQKTTAPLTFNEWKRVFNIPVQRLGETLEAYRARTDVVIYYNKNELGLGRELGCAEFDDGTASDGTPLVGVACYVTNYGTAFGDVVNSLPRAVEGLRSKNTLCITYRPSLPANYRVQFYAYNGDGDRREWAELDTLGPRPLPQVCMNCHGGSYDSERHLAKYARFLPMDPNVVVFASSGTPGGVSREAQEERIRRVNLLSARSPLTPDQLTMLDKLYDGKMDLPQTRSATEWAPDAWSDTTEHRQLFDKVLKPYCWTCHAAMQNNPNGDVLAIYSLFDSPALLEAGLPAQLCNTFTMPNSQATRLNFWEPFEMPLVFTDNKTYDSAADLLLSRTGVTREQCIGLEQVTSCNRGADPDALCGNAFSGRACDLESGLCVPNLKAPRNPGESNGVCKTDGSRNCPYPQPCVATGKPIAPGLPGYDGLCASG
jgi:hypothetical protein